MKVVKELADLLLYLGRLGHFVARMMLMTDEIRKRGHCILDGFSTSHRESWVESSHGVRSGN